MHELAGKNYIEQDEKRLMGDEITDGIDELGVLLCGHAKGAYWYGSQLDIHTARKLIEHNSATSLQVCYARGFNLLLLLLLLLTCSISHWRCFSDAAVHTIYDLLLCRK